MGERAGISTKSLCFQFSVGWHNNVWPQIKLELIVDIRRFSPLSSQQQYFKYSYSEQFTNIDLILVMIQTEWVQLSGWHIVAKYWRWWAQWPGARAVTPRLTHQPDNTCCRDGAFCQYRPFWIWIKWHDINVRAQERWSSLRLYVRVWSNEASMMWRAREIFMWTIVVSNLVLTS